MMNHPAAQLLAANDGLLATRFGLRAERPGSRIGRSGNTTGTERIATSCNAGLHRRNSNCLAEDQASTARVDHSHSQPAVEWRALRGAFAVITDPPRRNPITARNPPWAFRSDTCGISRGSAFSRWAIAERNCGNSRRVFSTVKSQIASIYSKTATCRQSQIARLLGRLSVVVSDDCTS